MDQPAGRRRGPKRRRRGAPATRDARRHRRRRRGSPAGAGRRYAGIGRRPRRRRQRIAAGRVARARQRRRLRGAHLRLQRSASLPPGTDGLRQGLGAPARRRPGRRRRPARQRRGTPDRVSGAAPLRGASAGRRRERPARAAGRIPLSVQGAGGPGTRPRGDRVESGRQDARRRGRWPRAPDTGAGARWPAPARRRYAAEQGAGPILARDRPCRGRSGRNAGRRRPAAGVAPGGGPGPLSPRPARRDNRGGAVRARGGHVDPVPRRHHLRRALHRGRAGARPARAD